MEFSDDRLGNLAHRLSDDPAWEALEQDLWQATMDVYELEVAGVRLDSTTSYGYHQPTEEGVMQYGHSKDHRSDLPQLKLMAAAAEPSGHRLSCDVHPGECADDGLYIPLIARVRGMVGCTGVLYAGDSKMAALSTRAYLAAHQDYYLVPLPRMGQTASLFEEWVEAAVEGFHPATLVWQGDRLLGAGYEFERPVRGVLENGQEIGWTEQVVVVRSLSLARRQQATLERHLTQAEAEVWALTPALGRGKRQIREEGELSEAIARILDRHGVRDILRIPYQRQETRTTRYVGPGRGGPHRPTCTEVTVRYQITSVGRDQAALKARVHRLGWRVYATNAPQKKLSFQQTGVHYRGGWSLEHDFHLVKDLPLGLSPLFVWKDDQIKGLTRLLTLALRLRPLLQTQVRQELAKEGDPLEGLYEGQPTHTPDRPTGKRILKAFAQAQITLTCVEIQGETYWHLTPLPSVLERILRHLRLPESIYTSMVHNSS